MVEESFTAARYRVDNDRHRIYGRSQNANHRIKPSRYEKGILQERVHRFSAGTFERRYPGKKDLKQKGLSGRQQRLVRFEEIPREHLFDHSSNIMEIIRKQRHRIHIR